MIDSHIYTQRIDMKSYGTMEGVYINGAPQGITFHETDNFTLYPASIISINKNRFTKHYFIGDKRIASRIGTGLFNNVYGRNGSYVTAGQQDYAERMNQIQKQKEAYYKQQGIAPGVPTMKGAYGDPENTGVGYNSILTELGNHDVPQGWIQTPRPNTTPNTSPGPPVSWNDPSNPDDPQAGYGYIPNDTTIEETFFYHSDHLGSTSYITDEHANITQYDAYLPYGELLVDEHSSSENLPYKFNGKQFDEETGLYYYGARYMNPMASLWYGVDALTEKYPNVTGYCYTFNNPIKLLDPDGNSPIGAAVEGISAFVVSAGVDFISNWIFEGMDYKTAFSHVRWGAAAFDGISTAAISLLVDGAGTTKTIGKIANSKAGRFAIDVARTMITNIIGDIEKGTDFNKIDLTEEFISATFSTLLDKGMEKRANELLSGLERSNKKLYTALNKLKRNQKAGKSETRLKSDASRVKIAKDRYRGDVRKYAKAVTKKNLVVAGADLASEKAFERPDKETSNKNNK